MLFDDDYFWIAKLNPLGSWALKVEKSRSRYHFVARENVERMWNFLAFTSTLEVDKAMRCVH